MAPRQFKIGLLGALGPSKSRSKVTFFGSKSLQERSKRRPRALHTPLEGILWPTKPFSRAQEASRTPTRGLQGPFGSHVSRILKQFCYPFEAMLPPCWSRFLAKGSFDGPSPLKEQPEKHCFQQQHFLFSAFVNASRSWRSVLALSRAKGTGPRLPTNPEHDEVLILLAKRDVFMLSQRIYDFRENPRCFKSCLGDIKHGAPRAKSSTVRAGPHRTFTTSPTASLQHPLRNPH